MVREPVDRLVKRLDHDVGVVSKPVSAFVTGTSDADGRRNTSKSGIDKFGHATDVVPVRNRHVHQYRVGPSKQRQIEFDERCRAEIRGQRGRPERCLELQGIDKPESVSGQRRTRDVGKCRAAYAVQIVDSAREVDQRLLPERVTHYLRIDSGLRERQS